MPEDLGRYRRDFQERHPAYARDIDSYTVYESIDAFSLHNTRLWFGTSFYDGEGYTGVGTLGYFDIVRRQYEFIRLPEIADWSTTAILVEEGAVWIGLADHPEGASHSGGLLRYDRISGETRIYPIKTATQKSPTVSQKTIPAYNCTLALFRLCQNQGPPRIPVVYAATNTNKLGGHSVTSSRILSPLLENAYVRSSINMPAHPAANKPMLTAMNERSSNRFIVDSGWRFPR